MDERRCAKPGPATVKPGSSWQDCCCVDVFGDQGEQPQPRQASRINTVVPARRDDNTPRSVFGLANDYLMMTLFHRSFLDRGCGLGAGCPADHQFGPRVEKYVRKPDTGWFRRQFQAERPSQSWGVDVTLIITRQGRLYLAG
jgi:transposase InsO family protein